MSFHRSLLCASLLTALLLFLVFFGSNSFGELTRLPRHRLSDFDSGAEADESSSSSPSCAGRRPAAAPWDLEQQVYCDAPDNASATGTLPFNGRAKAISLEHVHPFVTEKVSTDQPNVSLMESLVPTLAELTEAEWVNVTVPPGLLTFIEIRTAKLISLAQIMHADTSLSLEDRRQFMERLLVNVNAVTRVGDKLCGEVNTYATRLTQRAIGGDSEETAASASTAPPPSYVEAIASKLADEESSQGASPHKTNLAREKRVRMSILKDLEERNAGWREAVRVCRMLVYKMEHYRPILDELMRKAAQDFMR